MTRFQSNVIDHCGFLGGRRRLWCVTVPLILQIAQLLNQRALKCPFDGGQVHLITFLLFLYPEEFFIDQCNVSMDEFNSESIIQLLGH